MGCCGCTLQTSAIVAAVFGIIESLAGILGGAIACSSDPYAGYIIYPFSIVRNVLISAAVFNAIWLVATIVLIIGIVQQNAAMHRVWVGVTSVIMVVDLAHSIAFVVGYVKMLAWAVDYKIPYSIAVHLYDNIGVFGLLITATSRSSILLLIVNICLTIYTAHRANEIERGGPAQPGTTVHVYGQQPIQQPYPMTGQTIIVQHTGPSTGMPPNYDQQQPQYGQPQGQYGQPQGQYGQPQRQYGQPQAPDQGIPGKY